VYLLFQRAVKIASIHFLPLHKGILVNLLFELIDTQKIIVSPMYLVSAALVPRAGRNGKSQIRNLLHEVLD
jgi:hypothetical protein